MGVGLTKTLSDGSLFPPAGDDAKDVTRPPVSSTHQQRTAARGPSLLDCRREVGQRGGFATPVHLDRAKLSDDTAQEYRQAGQARETTRHGLFGRLPV